MRPGMASCCGPRVRSSKHRESWSPPRWRWWAARWRRSHGPRYSRMRGCRSALPIRRQSTAKAGQAVAQAGQAPAQAQSGRHRCRPGIRGRPDGRASPPYSISSPARSRTSSSRIASAAAGTDTTSVRFCGVEPKANYQVTFEDGSNPATVKTGVEMVRRQRRGDAGDDRGADP